jgi:sodium/bile acid cotransporter 7
MSSRRRFLPDNFTLALIATVAAASVLPSTPVSMDAVDSIAAVAIALLFFLHGAKLPRQAILAGFSHWRLHLTVLCCTFVMFPLLGLALQPVLTPLVTPELYLGILFLCVLPSTVQSSIAFTSLARGNVPAAICSASASNLAGIFVTPLLAAIVLASARHGNAAPPDALLRIVLQLLLPFIAGQVARRWIGAWVDRRKNWIKPVDQGAILLVVYSAFSEAMAEGLFGQLSPQALAGLLFINVLLLALAMGLSAFASRRFGFGREDEITIVFCGSKKSLASGIPMAKVLFAGQALGVIVLPLMLFHQIQLMVCALLAQRYAARPGAAPVP